MFAIGYLAVRVLEVALLTVADVGKATLVTPSEGSVTAGGENADGHSRDLVAHGPE